MSRKKHLPPSFYDEPFFQLFKESSRKRESLRYLGLHHLQQGCTYEEVSQQIGTSIDAIFRWVRKYRNKGIEGLKEGRRSGRPRRLDKDQQEQFKSLFLDAQANRMGGRLTGKDANEIVQEQFAVSYSPSGIYVLLHACGLSWITGRSRHPAHDTQAQDEFKKTLLNR